MFDEPITTESTPLVVVLGMHRSGTSYVAQVLNAAGFNLGDDAQCSGECDNLAGHWESQSVVAINDRILNESMGTWYEPPTQLTATNATQACIERFVCWMSHRAPFAFKDPRTTITFPIWRDRLPHYQLIACLRHPMAVAQSLQVRQGWCLEQGLKLWIDYNRRLLECLQDEPTALLFDFNADAMGIERWFENCFHQMGVRNSISAGGILNPYLRHHDVAGSIADPLARDIYDHLKSLATTDVDRNLSLESPSGGTILPTTTVHDKANQPMPAHNHSVISERTDESSPKDILFQVENLADVSRRHDQVVQQLDQRFREAEGKSTQQFQRQQESLHVLEQWTHERYERLAAESADEHARLKTTQANLSQIAADHETIVDQVGHLSRRCDQLESALRGKTEQITLMLNNLNGQLATCNQAFTAINFWLPLRIWRGIRKKANAVLSSLSRKKSTPAAQPNAAAPAPHWVERDATPEQRRPTITHGP